MYLVRLHAYHQSPLSAHHTSLISYSGFRVEILLLIQSYVIAFASLYDILSNHAEIRICQESMSCHVFLVRKKDPEGSGVPLLTLMIYNASSRMTSETRAYSNICPGCGRSRSQLWRGSHGASFGFLFLWRSLSTLHRAIYD